MADKFIQKIHNIDAQVIKTMVETGRENFKLKMSGSRKIRCGCCRQILRDDKGGAPLVDYQNYRTKVITDYDGVTPIVLPVCEPCNRRVFEGTEWTGQT